MSEKVKATLKKHAFKKGQSGNPLGGKLHNPAIRALKNLTVEVYREVIELALVSNIAALQEVANNPNTPAVQVGVAKALIVAIRKGDWNIVNAIAERIVGKIPDKIEHTGLIKNEPPSKEQLLELLKEIKNDC